MQSGETLIPPDLFPSASTSLLFLTIITLPLLINHPTTHQCNNDENKNSDTHSQIISFNTRPNIERGNIQYRLNSGRANYIAKGGKLGRKTGSTKTDDKKKEEYKEVIALLKKGYSIRNIAKLQSIGISTVQRIKNQFIKP